MSNTALPQIYPKDLEKIKSNDVFLKFNQINSQPQLTNLENFVRSQSTFLSVTGQLEAIGRCNQSQQSQKNEQNQVLPSTNNSTNHSENK